MLNKNEITFRHPYLSFNGYLKRLKFKLKYSGISWQVISLTEKFSSVKKGGIFKNPSNFPVQFLAETLNFFRNFRKTATLSWAH